VIQNVSLHRSNKRVTLKDLSYARCFSALPVYPGASLYAISGSGTFAKRYTAGFCLLYLYYIKGTGHNKCKVCWCWDSNFVNTSPNSSTFQFVDSAYNSYSAVFYKSGDKANSWEIYPSLTIEEGEEKMVLDYCYWAANVGVFADGSPAASVPLGRRFGLYFATPKSPPRGEAYFHSVVIFTPKPWLFDANRPS
jgi:hypothetical protein